MAIMRKIKRKVLPKNPDITTQPKEVKIAWAFKLLQQPGLTDAQVALKCGLPEEQISRFRQSPLLKEPINRKKPVLAKKTSVDYFGRSTNSPRELKKMKIPALPGEETLDIAIKEKSFLESKAKQAVMLAQEARQNYRRAFEEAGDLRRQGIRRQAQPNDPIWLTANQLTARAARYSSVFELNMAILKKIQK
ncbi:MAG: hypothetical protein PHD95_00050 [Candidatus ainarchaeum sp.]|nr:hypothetical protein [Candidatus ainarchaeum sp.]